VNLLGSKKILFNIGILVMVFDPTLSGVKLRPQGFFALDGEVFVPGTGFLSLFSHNPIVPGKKIDYNIGITVKYFPSYERSGVLGNFVPKSKI